MVTDATTITASRPWLKHYPPGVAFEVDVTRFSSLPAMAEEAFRKYASRPAFTCMDKTLTYKDVDLLSQALGAWLQSRGLKQGARVALMMPNVLQYPVAIIAVLRAGYVVANVNPLYTPRELEHQLNDCGAEAIIILENFAPTLEAVIGHTKVKTVVLASVGDLLGFPQGLIANFVVRRVKKAVPPFNLPGAVRFNDTLDAGRGMTLSKPNLGPDDIAFLQYTGGTTGVAKGAILVHSNITSNSMIAEEWLHGTAKSTEIDGDHAVLRGSQIGGDAACGVQFHAVALAIVERQGVTGELAAAGDGEARGRIQTATQQANRFGLGIHGGGSLQCTPR